MSVRMVIELQNRQTAESIFSALEAYMARLQTGIERSQRQLAKFEEQYGVPTEQFLKEMVAEDLEGGDLEYVEWAGEAKLLAGLKQELAEEEVLREISVLRES